MCVNTSPKQYGVTLVELIVFIMIVGVALAGVLKVLEVTTRGSADPLIRKQAIAIAESLLQEIQQQPFTLCDPDDPNVATALTAAECTGGVAASQNKGGAALTSPTPSTENRYSNSNPLDNVADYGGFSMPNADCAGICGQGDTTPIANLYAYTATVSITRVGGATSFAAMPLDAALRIVVRVTGPANTDVTLTGYRTRYAPNL